jgi:radical SAM protein with 4Fe4S-binding SPASM domain
MKIKRFHQFVRLEKGVVNTAIINLLNGHIYQVENTFIEKFTNKKYDDIAEDVNFLEKEELIIEVDENAWIPAMDPKWEEQEDLPLIIEIDTDVDTGILKRLFQDFKIDKIHYYGKKELTEIIPGVEVIGKEKNFSKCTELSTVDGELKKIHEYFYRFNKAYNTCWGKKLAITNDLKVRPCIYSRIIIGDINRDNADDLIENALKYWGITKDKVEKCKDCELRYTCFDCRESAYRATGNLFAANPNCNYNPYNGSWSTK